MANTQTGPIVSFTDAARREVARILAEEKKNGQGLRLAVKGGGCSGLSYMVEFGLPEPGDTLVDFPEGFQVLVDAKSLLYLKGIEVDYQSGLSGKGFTFHNPNAGNTCGCGESFSV